MRRWVLFFEALFIVIFTLLQRIVDAKIGHGSYAFLNVRSRYTPSDGMQFCVNFQQYDKIPLPTTLADAAPLRLAWWNDSIGETNVCRKHRRLFSANDLVPALYRTNVTASVLAECNITSKIKNHLMYWQWSLMSERNVTQALWLLNRGEKNSYGLHDYLFTYFSNPQMQNAPPISFYMYRDVFFGNVLPYIYAKKVGSDSTNPLSVDSDVAELRFYRPARSFPIDAGIFVISSLAVFSVLLGSIWAAYDTWMELNFVDSGTHLCEQSVKEESPQTSSSSKQKEEIGREIADSTDHEQSSVTIADSLQNERASIGGSYSNNQRNPSPQKRQEQCKNEEAVALAAMHWAGHCYAAFCFLLFLTVTLMLAYYFRQYAVYVFDVFIFMLGIMSVYKVVYTAIHIRCRAQSHDIDIELFSLGQIFYGVPTDGSIDKRGMMTRLSSTRTCAKPIRLLSLLVFCGSTAFCSIWLYMWLNEHPYAFIMLDLINMCLCIVAIRNSTCRSMRLIVFIMATLFFYDLFMVFGSKLVTSDGCSIMIQVVTGIDCVQPSTSNLTERFPIASIDQNMPKKIPIALYVPFLTEPMNACYDVEVERGFQFLILGLGDIILPGFLVSYAFYIDVAKRHRFYSFGLITWLGYILGLELTYLALHITQIGQPALIYIVPCTTLPFLLWARYNGLLQEVWHGGDLTRSL